MVSLAECKKILNKNKNGITYTDEMVKKVAQLLDNLATIDFEKFKEKNK
jgi:glucan phosphoethanolaminetransferase (alkaline phosphatase superfamily)